MSLIYCVCGDCSPGGTICRQIAVRVRACGIDRPGVVVTFTQGSTTIVGTTNSTGVVAINVPTTGSWAYSVPGSGNYCAASGVVPISTCLPAQQVPLLINMPPCAGYACIDDICCPTGGPPPYPVRTWPTTIYLNDGFGAVACTGGGSSAVWSGCAMRMAANAYDCSVLNRAGEHGDYVTNVLVPVFFNVGCNFVSVDFYRCSNPDNGICWTPYGNGGIGMVPSVGSPSGCDPGFCGLLYFGYVGGTGYPPMLGSRDSFAVNFTSGICPPSYTASGTQTLSSTKDDGSGDTEASFGGYQVYGSTASFSVSP